MLLKKIVVQCFNVSTLQSTQKINSHRCGKPTMENDDLPWFTHSNCLIVHGTLLLTSRHVFSMIAPVRRFLSLALVMATPFPLGGDKAAGPDVPRYPGRNFSKIWDVTHKLEIQDWECQILGTWYWELWIEDWGILVCLYPLSHQAGTSSLRHGNSRFCQTSYDICLTWKWWFHGSNVSQPIALHEICHWNLLSLQALPLFSQKITMGVFF